MKNIINVGKEFYHRLANRNKQQGDGKYTAIEFRKQFLQCLDNVDVWKQGVEEVALDFSDVQKIGPSFANEAFGYFTKYASPQDILTKIEIVNIKKVHLRIIEQELETAYNATK